MEDIVRMKEVQMEFDPFKENRAEQKILKNQERILEAKYMHELVYGGE